MVWVEQICECEWLVEQFKVETANPDLIICFFIQGGTYSAVICLCCAGW